MTRSRSGISESTAAAFREWQQEDPRGAHNFQATERRQDESDARWNARRRAYFDRSSAPPDPKTRPRASTRQLTSFERGAESLLSPIDFWYGKDGDLLQVATESRLLGSGPGCAALMPAPTTPDGTSLRPDWNRAEFIWAAAVLYLDFHAAYREVRRIAPQRATLQAMIELWPTFDQRPLLQELRTRGLNGADLVKELNARTPPRRPPTQLLPALSLVSQIGKGAHILAADVSTLDLGDIDQNPIPSGVRVADLPDRLRNEILKRRDRRIHVRRIPALPQERGACSDQRSGTALADIMFAGHSISRHLSKMKDPPRRVVDVASDALLSVLYAQGAKLAAMSAVGRMLDRSATTVRGYVADAKRLNLVTWENTRQAE